MKQKPLFNAAGAVVYIVALVSFIHFITALRHDTPDTLLDGVGAISLFVTSAAVMAFLFFYQPVALLIEHKKKEAVSYFLTTIAIFGAITAVVLVLILSVQ